MTTPTYSSGVVRQGEAQGAAAADEVDVVIDKLLTVRGARPGKPVQLLEAEIKMLCYRCVHMALACVFVVFVGLFC